MLTYALVDNYNKKERKEKSLAFTCFFLFFKNIYYAHHYGVGRGIKMERGK